MALALTIQKKAAYGRLLEPFHFQINFIYCVGAFNNILPTLTNLMRFTTLTFPKKFGMFYRTIQKIPPPIQDMKAFIHSLSNNPHPNDIRLIAVSLLKLWTAQNAFWIQNKNDSLGIIMQSILNYFEELNRLEEGISDVP